MTQINYLESEDAAFAHAFHLSEEDVLGCYGSLKAYTRHRLDRADARRTDIPVDYLPDTPEAALGHYKIDDPKLTDAGLARELIKEQIAKVRGILDGIKADKSLKAATAFAQKQRDDVDEMGLKALRREAANRFGWPEDGQMAAEWSKEQLRKQKAHTV